MSPIIKHHEINHVIPRILLTAPSSGSGKTLITCGLLQALKNRGLKVASFKCGPDYIDPMFHETILDTKSSNLDTFLTTPNITNYLLAKNSYEMDISVLEGVMGYYDGLAGTKTEGSTYHISSVTNTPSILIVSCKGMSVSILPLIKGFLNYKEDHMIKGVILNGISPMLYPDIKSLIEEELSITVYGYVPMVKDLVIESRHLGLITPNEIDSLKDKINRLANLLEETVNIDGLISLSKTANPIQYIKPYIPHLDNKKVRIAVAKDEAFCFYYKDNLTLLEEMGAQIVYFSPIKDKSLPEDIQGIILYGGYPELYAKELSDNTSMLHSIKSAVDNGVYCVAECGGFMYLHSYMEDINTTSFPMVNLIPGTAYKTEKLNRFGYILLTSNKDSLLCKKGDKIAAHEFHYWDSDSCGLDFTATKPYRKRRYECIHMNDKIFGGYPHIHYYSNIELCFSMLLRCKND